MEEFYLSFSINKNNTRVISINDDDFIVGLSFDTFFNKYLSSNKLAVEDSKYDSDDLLSYFLTHDVEDYIIYNTTSLEYKYKFLISYIDEDIITVSLYRIKIEVESRLNYDYLTGVYTRSYASKLINENLSDCDVENSYFLMFDLDNYKSINDTFGHSIGDLCLKNIATQLNEIFSKHIFGRYGGDEFFAFCKNVTVEEIYNLIQSVLKICFQYDRAIKISKVITCSIGVTKVEYKNKNLSELIVESDKALYGSKKKGKNIASFYKGRIIRNNTVKKDLLIFKFKEKKEFKVEKNQLFKKEIKKKNILSTFLVAISVILIFTSMFIGNIFYGKEIDKQSESIAKNFMGEQSSNIDSIITFETENYSLNLKLGTTIADNVEYKTTNEAYLDEIIEELKVNIDIENPAILLENGDLYYGNGNIYNISMSIFAKNVIIDSKPSIDIIKFTYQGDKVLIGYPYQKRFGNTKEGTLSIKGLVNILNLSDFKEKLYKYQSNTDSRYVAIVKNSGEKVCELQNDSNSIFSGFNNVLNYFSSINKDDYYNKLNQMLASESQLVYYFNLPYEGYYVYTNTIATNDWVILIAAPYSLIYSYYGRIVDYSNISLNIICYVSLALILLVLIFLYRSHILLFKRKYTDSSIGGINVDRFVIDGKELLKSTPNNNFIVYINIKRFKMINRILKSDAKTNILLRKIMLKIESMIDRNELICRDYKDRFILFLKCEDIDECNLRIKDILENIKNINVDGETINLSLLCGIYKVETEYETIEGCIEKARYSIENLVVTEEDIIINIFDEKMRVQNELEIYIEEHQQEALDNNKFEVFYQPMYNLNTEKFDKCEALVRWKDEKYGYINTQTFIDVFERNGFINKLDFYVFNEVIKDMVDFKKMGREIIKVSINLSRNHFFYKNFFNTYEDLINKNKIDTKYLEFEITESIILNSEMNINDVIKRIHAIGSTVSIDDFGSGFSNLSMLNHVDYDVIKLDKTLLYGKNGFDSFSKKIIDMTIYLNKSLGKMVVCEGVEEKEEVDYLKYKGCDYIQGYYYSKPIKFLDFVKFIDENNNK